MGTWRTLRSQRILHAPLAISVHGGVSPGKSQTWSLLSGVECSSELPNAENHFHKGNVVLILLFNHKCRLSHLNANDRSWCNFNVNEGIDMKFSAIPLRLMSPLMRSVILYVLPKCHHYEFVNVTLTKINMLK